MKYNYKLSRKADSDIIDIYQYSLSNFGQVKAEEYLISLHDSFITLSNNPYIGRDYSFVCKDIFRFEHKYHSIFYMFEETEILVVRVLHSNMDVERHI